MLDEGRNKKQQILDHGPSHVVLTLGTESDVRSLPPNRTKFLLTGLNLILKSMKKKKNVVIPYYNRKLFTFRFVSYRTSFTHKIKKKNRRKSLTHKATIINWKKNVVWLFKAFTLEKVLQH